MLCVYRDTTASDILVLYIEVPQLDRDELQRAITAAAREQHHQALSTTQVVISRVVLGGGSNRLQWNSANIKVLAEYLNHHPSLGRMTTELYLGLEQRHEHKQEADDQCQEASAFVYFLNSIQYVQKLNLRAIPSGKMYWLSQGLTKNKSIQELVFHGLNSKPELMLSNQDLQHLHHVLTRTTTTTTDRHDRTFWKSLDFRVCKMFGTTMSDILWGYRGSYLTRVKALTIHPTCQISDLQFSQLLTSLLVLDDDDTDAAKNYSHLETLHLDHRCLKDNSLDPLLQLLKNYKSSKKLHSVMLPLHWKQNENFSKPFVQVAQCHNTSLQRIDFGVGRETLPELNDVCQRNRYILQTRKVFLTNSNMVGAVWSLLMNRLLRLRNDTGRCAVYMVVQAWAGGVQ